MKVDIADAHKNIFSYGSFLKNWHGESRIVSRDVDKFNYLCYKFIFRLCKIRCKIFAHDDIEQACQTEGHPRAIWVTFVLS
jgi:hypothetical protein